MKKRVLSLALVVFLLIGMLPRMAVAAESSSTEIATVTITGVTEPVAGEAFDESFNIPGDANYTKFRGTWYESSTPISSHDEIYNATELKDGDTFTEGMYYGFLGEVAAKDGYVFAQSGEATMNGSDAGWYSIADYDTKELRWLRVSLSFGQAEAPVTVTEIGQVGIMGVTLPEVGQLPDREIRFPTGAKYGLQENGGLVWLENSQRYSDFDQMFANGTTLVGDATFQDGKYYTLLVRLKAGENTVFTGNTTANIDGTMVNTEWYSNATDWLDVWYTFDKVEAPTTEIETVAITGVTAPVAGEKPSYEVTLPEGAGYSQNGVRWYVSDSPITGSLDLQGADLQAAYKPFEAGKYYSIRVDLMPSEGYEFSSYATATVNGETAVRWLVQNSDTGENDLDVCYSFYLPEETTEITSAAVTGVGSPMAGETPVNSVAVSDGAGYTVDYVGWYVSDAPITSYADLQDNGQPHGSNDPFEAGKYYTVRVNLRPGEGYAFAQAVTGTVDGKEAITHLIPELTTGETCLVLLYSFLAGEADTPITQVAITDVDAPVAGAVPDSDYTVPADGGYVADGCRWYKSEFPLGSVGDIYDYGDRMSAGETFEDGYYYTFLAYLVADEGYEYSTMLMLPATVNGETAHCETVIDETQRIYLADVVYCFDDLGDGDFTEITSVAVTGVTLPVVGRTCDASYTVPAGQGYSALDGGLWGVSDVPLTSVEEIETLLEVMEPGDTFQAGKYYTFLAYLTADEGYIFGSDISATLNGMEAACVGRLMGTLDSAVYYVFGPLEESSENKISSVAITGVTAPVAGETPVCAHTLPEGVNYQDHPLGLYAWVESDAPFTSVQDLANVLPMDPEDTFQAGKYYTYVTLLLPNDGYAFAQNMSATVNGNSASNLGDVLGDSSAAILYCFGMLTEEGTTPTVSVVTITGMTPPVAGEEEDDACEIPAGANYELGGSAWMETTYAIDTPDKMVEAMKENTPFSGTFQSGMYYSFIVGVIVEDGYEFSPSMEATINGEKAHVLMENSSFAYVWVCKEPGGEVILEPHAITDITVTGVVPPVVGALPSDAWAAPEDEGYMGLYGQWMVSDTPFTSAIDVLLNGDPVEEGETFQADRYYAFALVTAADDGMYYSTDLAATVNGKDAMVYVLGTSIDSGVQCAMVAYSFGTPVSEDTITAVSVTSVTEPVIGETPVCDYDVPQDANYSSSESMVLWVESDKPITALSVLDGELMDSTDIFQAGKYYAFIASLTANEGYTFADAGDMVGTMNGGPAFVGNLNKTDRIVIGTFGPLGVEIGENEITQVTVTDVMEPAVGEIADITYTIPENADYIIDEYNNIGCWLESDEPFTYDDKGSSHVIYLGDEDTFQEGMYYAFVAYLAPAEGYAFAQNVTGTMNGKDAVCCVYEGEYEGYVEGTLDVFYYFGELTDSVVVDTVTITEFAEPVVGADPEYGFAIPEDADYTVEYDECDWYVSDTAPTTMIEVMAGEEVWPDDTFEAGKYYTAVFYLNPLEYSAFADDVAATVNGAEANVYRYDPDSEYADYIDVWITYGPLDGGTSATMIAQVQVDDVVPPVEGEVIDRNFTVPENADYYREGGDWYVSDQPFTTIEEMFDQCRIMTSGETFQAGLYYAFDAYVTAEEGASFLGDVTATMNGEDAQVYRCNGSEIEVVYIFGQLEKAPTLITQVDILDVNAPALGESPVDSFSVPEGANYGRDSYYVGFWAQSDAPLLTLEDVYDADQIGAFEFDTFQPGVYYTYLVCLVADEGCRFAEDLTFTMNGQEGFGYVYGPDEDYAGTLDAWFTFPPIIVYDLWIGGKQVTSEYLSNEAKDWSFDPETNTLTLSDANISSVAEGDEYVPTDANSCGIYSGLESLTIVLKGSSTVTSGSIWGNAIYSLGDLTIQGEGSLTAEGGWVGIAADGDITIGGGTVKASGEYGHGIVSEAVLTINGGDVQAQGKGRGASGAEGQVINGGTVLLQGQEGASYLAPDLSGYPNADVTASKNFDGSEPAGEYDPEAIYDYKYLKIEAGSFNITYESMGGSTVEPGEVDPGEMPTRPEDPAKEGHTFLGWFLDEALTTPYNFSEPLTGNIILYAGWELETYTVTYETFGGSTVEPETVEYGSCFTQPEDPAKEGNTFLGWFTDESLTTAYDFSEPVSGDITLYAGWEIEIYTITFDPSGGTVEPATMETGKDYRLSSLPEASWEGHIFLGWFLAPQEARTAEQVTTETVFEGDTIVYAHWELETYTVTYETFGGSDVEPETVEYGNCFTQPEDPTKKGNTFLGWFTDESLTTAYDFSEPASGDITLYADWQANTPDTGDNSHTGLWLVLGLMAVLGLGLTAAIGRKGKEEQF